MTTMDAVTLHGIMIMVVMMVMMAMLVAATTLNPGPVPAAGLLLCGFIGDVNKHRFKVCSFSVTHNVDHTAADAVAITTTLTIPIAIIITVPTTTSISISITITITITITLTLTVTVTITIMINIIITINEFSMSTTNSLNACIGVVIPGCLVHEATPVPVPACGRDGRRMAEVMAVLLLTMILMIEGMPAWVFVTEAGPSCHSPHHLRLCLARPLPPHQREDVALHATARGGREGWHFVLCVRAYALGCCYGLRVCLSPVMQYVYKSVCEYT